MRQVKFDTTRVSFETDAPSDAGPARLITRPDWADDTDFRNRLETSWRIQYADYLGEDPANRLVDRLLATGDLLDHDPTLTRVAEMDGEPVGIGALRQASDHCLITLLEVVDSHRRLGIGRQLVRAMIEHAQPLISHVSIYRPDMLSFYAKLGFRYFDRITIDHYGFPLEFDLMFRH